MAKHSISKELIEAELIKYNYNHYDMAKANNWPAQKVRRTLIAYSLWELVDIKAARHSALVDANKNRDKEASKQKAIKTNLERYGVEHTTQASIMKEKSKATFLERYGVEHYSKTEAFKEKFIKTSLKRYGVTNPAKLPSKRAMMSAGLKLAASEALKKRTATNLERYGVNNPNQIGKAFVPEIYEKDSFEQLLLKYPMYNTVQLEKELGVSKSVLYRYLNKFNLWHLVDKRKYASSYEYEIIDILKSIKPDLVINHAERSILNPYEIDIYLPEYNLGIEFNGSYWHSAEFKTRTYHFDKTQKASEKGIQLYHIFEHEWLNETKKDIIVSQLRNLLKENKRIIYARNTIIKEVSKKESSLFLNTNHIMGDSKSSIKLGLYYNNELVELLTLGSAFYSNFKYEYEIKRLCTIKDTTVVGGFSKLLKHFIKEYKPKDIMSYVDFSKGTGKGYEKLGFELIGYTKPAALYISYELDDVITWDDIRRYKINVDDLKEDYYKIYNNGNKKYYIGVTKWQNN